MVCSLISVALALFACRNTTKLIICAAIQMLKYFKKAVWWEYRLNTCAWMTEYLSNYQLFFVTAVLQPNSIILLPDHLYDDLQDGWREQIAPPRFAKVWIDMLDCFLFQLFDKGEVYRDELSKQLSWHWTAIVKKNPDVILKMARMSNCHVNLRTTRSAACICLLLSPPELLF